LEIALSKKKIGVWLCRRSGAPPGQPQRPHYRGHPFAYAKTLKVGNSPAGKAAGHLVQRGKA